MPDDAGTPRDLGPLIEAARGGSRDALGRAIEGFRDYLLLVADRELDAGLRAKEGASDVVQETFLEAQRAFGRFEGRTGGELRAWLREILRNRLAHFARRYRGTEKRRAGYEVPIEAGGLGHTLADDGDSPSECAMRGEEESALTRALDRLPEHYRQVLLWRHRDRLGFEEVGRRLESSTAAAQKLWVRAIERLQREMAGGKS